MEEKKTLPASDLLYHMVRFRLYVYSTYGVPCLPSGIDVVPTFSRRYSALCVSLHEFPTSNKMKKKSFLSRQSKNRREVRFLHTFFRRRRKQGCQAAMQRIKSPDSGRESTKERPEPCIFYQKCFGRFLKKKLQLSNLSLETRQLATLSRRWRIRAGK